MRAVQERIGLLCVFFQSMILSLSIFVQIQNSSEQLVTLLTILARKKFSPMHHFQSSWILLSLMENFSDFRYKSPLLGVQCLISNYVINEDEEIEYDDFGSFKETS